jgi:glycosyltransferase involved in cell wall biosynthesis
MPKILYIQHAGSTGGSAISLLTLVKALDCERYHPVVAFIHNSPEVIKLYTDAGIEAFHWPGIDIFPHTTGGSFHLFNPLDTLRFLRTILRFRASVRAAEALIHFAAPDIVHLNSLVLPSSAIAAKRRKVKLVWHIRESAVHGTFGIRKWWLGKLVKQLADESIFISEAGRKLLVDDQVGVVIPNYVDFRVFDHQIEGIPVRSELNIPRDAKVILFLGGRGVIKGIFPLLKAMSLIREQVPSAVLLVGGGAYHFSGRLASRIARTVLPLVGYGTVAQRVDKLVKRYHMQDYVYMLEWRSDIPQLLAASDVLVFPSIEPHFARPVIEAGAMEKPVVASHIGGVEELVVDGETGILVPPGNVEALARALVKLLSVPTEAQRMGSKGLEQALRRFSAQTNVTATVALYKHLQ